jgi:hypothetical protein
MRPVNFEFPREPEDIRPPGADFYLCRYTVLCDDGTTVKSVICVSKSAAYQAQRHRDACRPGVDSRGSTVIRDKVLKRDDPWLNWVVHMDGVVRDDYSLEE